ncbi:MAG TPA: Eco57I restriction-modification methylase domain-containing protein [Candidatus Acidoferrales bacterium]|nr:Eco57I restriction-modification methylase domain-containing protein [Candidatus Acidoferrales bacterium]
MGSKGNVKAKKRAYISRNWKVATPIPVVSLFWRITHEFKTSFGRVLDMGAGDCRFARGVKFQSYVGVEIDQRISADIQSAKVSYLHGCVFEHSGNDYDACIGNPPYLRHNEIENTWRQKMIWRFDNTLGMTLDRRSNLYLYFFLLGLQKTKMNGIVSVLVPYEWAFIPSAKSLRDYIEMNGWSVFVYRLNYSVFKGVQTTASVSIVDKSDNRGTWEYFDIDKGGIITQVPSFTESGQSPLEHGTRGRVWAMRGLSPGTNKVFTLTEGERVEANLTKKDVRACIISLKELPSKLTVLDNANFKKYFVSKNKKCWLIRTDKKPTSALKKYLRKIPEEKRSTWTCQNQTPWYRYKPHRAPKLLFGPAFKKANPLILFNKIKAIAVGSVIGIHTQSIENMNALHKKLRKYDFSSRLVPRDRGLKVIAVKQVNTVLNSLVKNPE